MGGFALAIALVVALKKCAEQRLNKAVLLRPEVNRAKQNGFVEALLFRFSH